MARIYSSVCEKKVLEIETQVRPMFHAGIGKDVDRLKALHSFINLDRKLSRLKHKVSVTVEEDKLVRLKEQIAKLEPTFLDRQEYVGYAVYRAVIRFNIFVDDYGFERMNNVLVFQLGLQSSEGKFNYYDTRR